MSLEIERIALKKAEKLDVSTQGHNYFSHGFARFSSMENLDKTQIPPATVTDGIDRLQQILKYGIISQSFAERIQLPFSRNYSDFNNIDNISLVGLYYGAWKAMSCARAGWFGDWSFFENPPPGSMFTIFIDHELKTQGKDISEGAKLRRFRVSQRTFLGIGGYRLSESSEALQEVVNTMLKMYSDRPDLVMPIYEVNRDTPVLLWPNIT